MQLENERLLRIPQIVGQDAVTEEQAKLNRERGKGPKRPRSAVKPLIPISRSSWYAGVKSGRYPKPVTTLGRRMTAWKASDIAGLIERLSNQSAESVRDEKPRTKPCALSSKVKVGAHV